MSRREQLATVLARTGSLDFILRLRRRTPVPWLTILTYHQFPDQSGTELFDEGVVDITPAEFERQIELAKRHFNVVGVEELCALAEGRPLPKNPVAIAFDDGYLGNHETALPILKKHDCKAMFFVATSFITERRIYWWDRIAYVIKASPRSELTLEYPGPFSITLAAPRQLAIRRVLRLVKTHPRLDMDRFLAELSRAAAVAWTPAMDRAFAERLLMTWDHVRALREAGMDVQSHTRTHRVLQTLGPSDLSDELEGSRADLARELGEPARALAYPVGNPLALNSPVRRALEKSGYEIGLTNGTGPTPLGKPIDRFDIRRQTIERDVPEALFLAMLALPRLAPKHPWHLPSNIIERD